MRFFLGTHHPHWLADARFMDVPLFVSHRQISRYKTLPRAVGEWALDSGGFVAALRWHLLALPSWDPTPAPQEPHGRPCVRVTALVRTRQGLRAVVVDAPTEGAALDQLALHGVRP